MRVIVQLAIVGIVHSWAILSSAIFSMNDMSPHGMPTNAVHPHLSHWHTTSKLQWQQQESDMSYPGSISTLTLMLPQQVSYWLMSAFGLLPASSHAWLIDCTSFRFGRTLPLISYSKRFSHFTMTTLPPQASLSWRLSFRCNSRA